MLSKVKKLTLILYTIKYLRLSQIYFRIYYNFSKLKSIPVVATLRDWSKSWTAPKRHCSPVFININEVICLGESGNLHDGSSWNNPQKNKLWLYNLHYFDDLNNSLAVNKLLLQKFIIRWINENPPFFGNGWEPYPISLRLVNFIKWFSQHPELLSSDILNSLLTQGQALFQRVEYHIGANHLFVNGKALIFIGAFLHGQIAEKWFNKGLEIVDSGLKEQFLADGGHFELSAMYHSSVLWDLCDLVHLADCTKLRELLLRREEWLQQIIKSYQWLLLMCHPDNGISFFNDAALDIAPAVNEIEEYLKFLNCFPKNINALPSDFSCKHLKESGFAIVQFNHNSKAIIDIGNIGPTYQPGHAHADTLSFELSLLGKRVIVNSGTSQYGEGEERQRQRGTKAHNTVIIDNKNSSEIWAGFRVARRAFPRDLLIENQKDKIKIACAHTGYLRLKNKNLHKREFVCERNKMTIYDYIVGSYTTAEARFYFHPDINLIANGPGCFDFNFANEVFGNIKISQAKDIQIEDTTWHPYFGKSIANKCLLALFGTQQLITEISW